MRKMRANSSGGPALKPLSARLSTGRRINQMEIEEKIVSSWIQRMGSLTFLAQIREGFCARNDICRVRSQRCSKIWTGSRTLSFISLIKIPNLRHLFSATNHDLAEQTTYKPEGISNTTNKIIWWEEQGTDMGLIILLVVVTLLLPSNIIMVAYLVLKIKRPQEVKHLACLLFSLSSSTSPKILGKDSAEGRYPRDGSTTNRWGQRRGKHLRWGLWFPRD